MQTAAIEKIMAILMLPISYLYVHAFYTGTYYRIFLALFTIAFLALVETFYFRRKRSAESVTLLVGTTLVLLGSVIAGKDGAVGLSLGRYSVWEPAFKILFLHLFAAYYVICRSDRLAEGKSSLLLQDAGILFFGMPFSQIFLHIGTIGTVFRGILTGRTKERMRKLPIVLLAFSVGLILLWIAVALMSAADMNYSLLMISLSAFFRPEWNWGTLVSEILLTLLLTPYLYGMLGGFYRQTEESARTRGSNFRILQEKCRRVPQLVWVLLIALFTAFYGLFFFVQGTVLIPTFFMKLPAGLTYAQNAHSGFIYMCGINFVNLTLLYLTMVSAERETPLMKGAVTLLTMENMLFSVIAFLKLLIYIQVFGFTPLRLKSVWLSVVLFYAGICLLVQVLSGKKTMRLWFIGSAASLAVLCAL